MAIIRVHNHRDAGHGLPPVGEFPGRNLLPGGNNVESEYLDALKAHMGDKAYARFLESSAGSLTFFTPEESVVEAKKPEGPPPPANLLDRIPELAIAFVEVEAEAKVLNQWLKADKRDEVKDAIRKRLQELKAK